MVAATAETGSAAGTAGSGERRVAAFVAEGIAAGRFAAGAQLPTERHLAAVLGLSRTAIRRGLAQLEAQGRITRHVGRGTFVAPPLDNDPPASIGRSTNPAEIMDVRLMLEPQIAALAAHCATGAEIDYMQQCLTQAEAARTTDEFETWDGALHRAIATATHNAFLVKIFESVHAVRDEPLWGSLKRRSFTPERRQDYQRDHRRIVEALAQRDGEEARRLMREHIVRVRENLLPRD